MFAYCENNPLKNEDPNGESLIGGIVGATTSALSAHVTGASTYEVLVAAGTGFLSGVVRSNKIAIAINLGVSIYTGVKTGIQSRSFVKGLLAGTISFGASFISSGMLNGKTINAGLNLGCSAAFDLTFGFGGKLVSDGMQQGLSTHNAKSSGHTKGKIRPNARPKTVGGMKAELI